MIHIFCFGVEKKSCAGLQATLEKVNIKFKLYPHEFSETKSELVKKNGCTLAIIDLQNAKQTHQKAVKQLKTDHFMLPTILINAVFNSIDDPCPLEEPVIDILAPGPVQLLANAVCREARLQQYKRLVAQTHNQTHDKHKRLSFMLEHMEDGVAVIQDGTYLEANPAYRRIFGISENESMIGTPIQEFLHHSEDHSHGSNSTTPLNTSLDSLGPNKIHSVHIQKRNGESFVTTLVKSTVKLLGKSATQIIIHNPDAWSNVERGFLDLRSQDVDTGLLNRRFFLERMDSIFNKRDDKTRGCFAFILLDGFREIRDKLGIKKSDVILKKIAESIVGLCGNQDILCRFGDHCFTLFSQNHDQISFLKHCDAIRTQIEQAFFGTEDGYNHITISVGISFVNRHVLNAQQLISQADHACGMACEKGGNQIQLFKTGAIALSTIEDEEKHIARIREALEENRLHLMYQPIVNLTEDAHENYAVLLRMVDLDGTQILPDDFILAAEQSHLITKLDQWVLHHCIKQLAAEAATKKSLRLFLKVSTQSIKAEDFLDSLLADLSKYGQDGANIVFQIDYSEAMSEHMFVKQFIHAVKEKTECKFAFDHVGFGEITDQTIQNFSIDFIKIDAAFTRNLLDNPDFQTTIQNVLEVTKRNQIPAIAKSVEDANSLATLWNMGVDMAQGYFLQHPADEMDYDFSLLNQ